MKRSLALWACALLRRQPNVGVVNRLDERNPQAAGERSAEERIVGVDQMDLLVEEQLAIGPLAIGVGQRKHADAALAGRGRGRPRFSQDEQRHGKVDRVERLGQVNHNLLHAALREAVCLKQHAQRRPGRPIADQSSAGCQAGRRCAFIAGQSRACSPPGIKQAVHGGLDAVAVCDRQPAEGEPQRQVSGFPCGPGHR